ncbi:MAG: 50S ribosomal protein L19 [Patescibacteria group bacterium]|nr:50S ribosomal protein L19 [Patescibacteria group bacterium]MDE2438396.1 50S ribosomal protein L19 [Patescibacteria group bacterium]
MNKLQQFTAAQVTHTLPDLKPGMRVRVSEKIKEKDKERKQAFTGIIIAIKHGKSAGAAFTVRAIVDGVGVEKVYPFNCPSLMGVEILGTSEVRRAKLYFLRKLSKKKSREKIGTTA